MISAFFSQFKMYFYLAVIAAIMGGVYWFNSVLDERTELRAENKTQKASIKTLNGDAEKSHKQALKDQKLAKDNLLKQEELQREKDKLKSDLANNFKRVQLNATCPKIEIGSIKSYTGTPVSETPELTGTAKEGVADLYYGIDANEELIAGLQARVIEDYEKCGAKLSKEK